MTARPFKRYRVTAVLHHPTCISPAWGRMVALERSTSYHRSEVYARARFDKMYHHPHVMWVKMWEREPEDPGLWTCVNWEVRGKAWKERFKTDAAFLRAAGL